MSQHKLPSRFKVSFERFLRLSFRQRLRILFGYNPIIEVNVLIDKRDGMVYVEDAPEVMNGIRLSLTPHPTERSLMESRLQERLATK